MKAMIAQWKTGIFLFFILTLITGVLYPLLITGVAQLFFPWQANGSLIQENEQIIGSSLIGQRFINARYFWGRPSSTEPFPYNAAHSSGSNWGPSNPLFLATVKKRVEELHHLNPESPQKIPVDLVTASGSGLDPEISPLSAFYQIARIATLRNIKQEVLESLVRQQIQHPTLGMLGEERINVLQLNRMLDHIGNENE